MKFETHLKRALLIIIPGLVVCLITATQLKHTELISLEIALKLFLKFFGIIVIIMGTLHTFDLIFEKTKPIELTKPAVLLSLGFTLFLQDALALFPLVITIGLSLYFTKDQKDSPENT